MKVSTKVECGIIALIDIAVNSADGKIVKVNEISKRNNISAKYLEQILPLLKNAGLIRSIKGAGGGYVLSRQSSEINLLDIVNSLDNTLFSDSSFGEKLESDATSAIYECLWHPVNDYLRNYSGNLTLEELTDKYKELQSNKEDMMYYI